MKKRVLKKIAILAAPIIWRRLRNKRGRHYWRSRHQWHRHHHCGHNRRSVWL